MKRQFQQVKCPYRGCQFEVNTRESKVDALKRHAALTHNEPNLTDAKLDDETWARVADSIRR